MTWLTVTEYLYHKLSRVCSVCHYHNLVIFLLHDLSPARLSNKAGTPCGVGTATLPEYPWFRWGSCYSIVSQWFVDPCLSFGNCIFCPSIKFTSSDFTILISSSLSTAGKCFIHSGTKRLATYNQTTASITQNFHQ